MAQNNNNIQYFLGKYEGLFQSYPRLEVNILQKFNPLDTSEYGQRLNMLRDAGIYGYIRGDRDYPDKVEQCLIELNSIQGGRKRRMRSKNAVIVSLKNADIVSLKNADIDVLCDIKKIKII